MKLKNYGRKQKKRKEYIKQSGLLLMYTKPVSDINLWK